MPTESTAPTGRAKPQKLVHRRGAVMALVAVGIVAFMGILVLAVDGGKLQRQRRIAQTAADAGALAGAVEKFRLRPESVTVNALAEAARNGFTNGANGVTISVDPAPATGSFTGPNYVKVVVSQTVPTLFAGMFGRSVVTTSSTGIAGVESATNCLVVMDPSAANALDIVAQGDVTADRCGVAVNSTSSSAVSVAGNLTASTVSVSGNENNPGGVTGTWQKNAPPTPDPLAYLTPPTAGSCKNGITIGWDLTNGQKLQPGTYCGGIRMGNNVSATLASGEYIIAGGGIDMKKATLTSDPGGVVIVNGNPIAGVSIPFAGFIIDVNSTVNLSAMAGGSLPGIVFYSNPPGIPSGTTGISLNSSANMTLNGSVYIPTEDVFLTTNVTLDISGGGLVARTVYAKTGNGSLSLHGGPGGSALRRPTLVQ